jgi:4-hydroxymandelate oxidase
MSARVPPLSDMINALDYEASAKARLDPSLFALIAGGDRRALERITFRPRMMVNTTGLDLTSELLGAKLFAPILVGPMADLKRFHPEGEVAMARGASAAKAAFVLSSECSVPVGEVAAVATSPWWYQVYADASPAASRDKIDQAAEAGAKALVITTIRVAKDWPAVSALRKGVKMPVVLKGVMTPAEAGAAVNQGVQAIVVSRPGKRQSATGLASPMEMLAAVVDIVAGRIPVLIDGGFRRGGDVLKALATGASAVLLARPVVWALSAYGSEGVQSLLETTQTDLARDMAMSGKVNLKALDRTLIRVHGA